MTGRGHHQAAHSEPPPRASAAPPPPPPAISLSGGSETEAAGRKAVYEKIVAAIEDDIALQKATIVRDISTQRLYGYRASEHVLHGLEIALACAKKVDYT